MSLEEEKAKATPAEEINIKCQSLQRRVRGCTGGFPADVLDSVGRWSSAGRPCNQAFSSAPPETSFEPVRRETNGGVYKSTSCRELESHSACKCTVSRVCLLLLFLKIIKLLQWGNAAPILCCVAAVYLINNDNYWVDVVLRS